MCFTDGLAMEHKVRFFAHTHTDIHIIVFF